MHNFRVACFIRIRRLYQRQRQRPSLTLHKW